MLALAETLSMKEFFVTWGYGERIQVEEVPPSVNETLHK